MIKGAKTVDEYITSAPRPAQAKLRELRAIIKEVAPTAREGISYRIPFYEYHGRLVYFGLQSNYIGLYLRPPVIQEHEKELAAYETTVSAVHLPLSEKVPVSLVKKLVKARMKINRSSR